jgi:phenylalanyl-tRNA synthetase beta chain
MIRRWPASLAALPWRRASRSASSTALGFAVDEDWTVTVPTWRPDIAGAPDLVEEVIRVHGLDAVPSAAARADGVARPTATPVQLLERRLRRAAAARGLTRR